MLKTASGSASVQLCEQPSDGVKIAVKGHDTYAALATNLNIASSYSTSPLSYHDANVNFAVERRVIIAVYRGCCQKSCLAYHKPCLYPYISFCSPSICNPLTNPFNISDHLEAPAMLQHTDVATRAFVVSLKAPCCGKSSVEVGYLSGQSIRQVDRIYARAIKNGFDPNSLPLNLRDDHLKDAPRSGRPKKVTEGADKVQDEGIQGEWL
ncbi:unnamed protein product [Fusarium graminearum]|nr:unnamed protein product [Fusarium graminearum]CAG2009728.1 unnamed protein product [Fusarium graminearum]